MFGEFVLFVLTCVTFLSLVAALAGVCGVSYDPIINGFARVFAAILSAGLTVVALAYGSLQLAILGGMLLAGLIIERVKCG